MSESPRLQKANPNEYAIGRREARKFHDHTVCTDSGKFEHKNATGRWNGSSRWRATRDNSNDLAIPSEKDAGPSDTTNRSVE